jgi:hypothetical protein
MLSGLLSHLHAYSQLWKTLLPRTSCSFWSIVLASEVVTPLEYFLWRHTRTWATGKIANKWRTLAANQAIHWPLTGFTKLPERKQHSFQPQYPYVRFYGPTFLRRVLWMLHPLQKFLHTLHIQNYFLKARFIYSSNLPLRYKQLSFQQDHPHFQDLLAVK